MHNQATSQSASPIEPLTERETEILALIAAGMTNREIANTLHLAEPTVRWYNTQIFEKLAVKNRGQATTRAKELGLLDKPIEMPAAPKHNLPSQTTLFVGRHQEMSDLALLLSNPDRRLITILGAGGMGKTRLALETARVHLNRYADGIYFIPLAPIIAVEHIIPAIGERVGLQFSDGVDPREQLLGFLSSKRMLLVLDNYEHLLDGANVISEILAMAPRVTILATSREKLALRAETIYTVTGMTFPAQGVTEDIRAYSAVDLFIHSAQRTRPDFVLRDDDLHHVAHVCRLVEGMPLALLLAATWVDMLSPAEIADEISASLDLLQTDLRDVPSHQRSVRATFDRSWQRLGETEQDIFMRLSVFRGGCTREAIAAVTSANLPALHRLVSQSLLQHQTTSRYSIHELLRQYAAEKLQAVGETNSAREAHSAHFLEFMQQLEPEVKGHGQLAALEQIEVDFENVRAAWKWAIATRNYKNVNCGLECLFQYCRIEERFKAGEELFQRARQALAPRPGEEPNLVWARALIRFPNNEAQIEQGLTIARQHNAIAEIARCYQVYGDWAEDNDNDQATADYYAKSADLFESVQDYFDMVAPLRGHAMALHLLGRNEEATAVFERAIQLGQKTGNMRALASAMMQYASVRAVAGAYVEAEQIVAEAIALQESRQVTSGVRGYHGYILLLSGDINRARQESQRALDAAIEHGTRVAWSQAVCAHVAYADGDYVQANKMAKDALTDLGRFKAYGSMGT